jgi:outer membrane protein assembly factor BamD
VRRAVLLLAALAAAALLSGCAGSRKPDQVTKDLLSLPKEQIFARGKALLEKKKYGEARKYLNFVFESYPNDPLGQQALLLVADSFFSRGTGLGYIEARYRYRDYLSRYPSAESRAFALYRYALCYDREHEKPDRDPTNTREALAQYRNLLKEVPSSAYAKEAQARIRALDDLLAEHEFDVGIFYFHKGATGAALARFVYTEDNYPDYDSRDKLFYFIGKSLVRLGREKESEHYFARLEAEYPKSPWADRARREDNISIDKRAASR